MIQVQSERHRARRYPFQANLEITDIQSETQTRERTTDLSLFGCHVDAVKPLEPGTRVSIKIAHGNGSFRALGRVAFVRSGAGMGIVFTSIQPNDQLILEKWLDELRQK
jgi:hypothetical protein